MVAASGSQFVKEAPKGATDDVLGLASLRARPSGTSSPDPAYTAPPAPPSPLTPLIVFGRACRPPRSSHRCRHPSPGGESGGLPQAMATPPPMHALRPR